MKNNQKTTVYKKGQSFSNLKTQSDSSFEEKIISLKLILNNKLNLTKQEELVLKACQSLLDVPSASSYTMQPHVKQEISRISTHELLAEYIFHRFRYDTHPKNKILDTFPPCVQIEPTSICNLRCVFCFQTDSLLTNKKEGHAGQMSLDLFKNIVDQLVGNVQFVTLASRGEPLLAKQIVEMLAYITGKFIGFKINTNATFLDEKRAHAILASDANTIVFSVDSANPETYAQMRVNGNLDKVINNIKNFIKIKERHYSNSKIITRVSGVDFDSAKQNFTETSDFWGSIVEQVAFVNYNPWENSYQKSSNDVTEPCSDLWRRTFIWWDGKVNPCDVDYRSFLSVGNVLDTNISEIWNGEAYNNLRKTHLNLLRKNLKPCNGCVVV